MPSSGGTRKRMAYHRRAAGTVAATIPTRPLMRSARQSEAGRLIQSAAAVARCPPSPRTLPGFSALMTPLSHVDTQSRQRAHMTMAAALRPPSRGHGFPRQTQFVAGCEVSVKAETQLDRYPNGGDRALLDLQCIEQQQVASLEIEK